MKKLGWTLAILLAGFSIGAIPATPIMLISSFVDDKMAVWPLFLYGFLCSGGIALSQPWKEYDQP